MTNLAKYLNALKKLNRGVTKYGKAPHKIILLLSLLQLARNKKLKNNKIFITPELIFLFKSNWSDLVRTENVCNFALPFWHLKGEKFWQLIPKSGYGSNMLIKKSVSSLQELNALVEYAVLDEDLFQLICQTHENEILQTYLIDEYFPHFKGTLKFDSDNQTKLFENIENKILHEKPSEYRNEIKKLLEEKNEEEIFIRSSIFKREVPKIYNYTCCISGMRIETTDSISMIDACHIVPFSESYNDTITNGIALCPNLHRAFDRGLIAIDNHFKVIVSSRFEEYNSIYGLKEFNGKSINLPSENEYYPKLENFEWHRNRVYKH